MVKEHDIEAYLHKQVKAAGGAHRRVKWIGRSYAPDDRCSTPRECFWAECKRPGYKVTPRVRAQRREHERMRRLGETVYVFDSFESIDVVMKRCN